MKKSAVRMVIALVVCALSVSMAVAAKKKVRSTNVTFGMDFMVGETLVPKGTYKLSFDEKTSELSVIAKDKSIVAKTIAHLEERKTANFGMEIVMAPKGGNKALVSFAFPGASKSIVIQAVNSQAALAR